MNIIITGASKGIGKAIAKAYAAEGEVLLLCARHEAALESTRAELQQLYPSCRVYVTTADLSVRSDTVAFANWCLQFGVPDILVNNAGWFLPGSVHDEADGNLEKMIDTNLYSAYHLTRALLPAMLQDKPLNGARHIFNICSIASLHAYPNGGAYSISKYALMGFSKNLREELKPMGIKVTSVYPGAVMTDSWGDYDNSEGRIMEAADIAAMILAAGKLSPQAVVEDIVMRPILGDL
ncbi:MAG: SDR family oxidoreductase [Chitinophagaceae bacterium]|nr:SDR family oxidoreductase [Chitinophagaceae bacterium]MBL0055715.1 SDR family oxidoreductase [Chitinophagaceae bacterium]